MIWSKFILQKRAKIILAKWLYFRTNLCDDPFGGMKSFKENNAYKTISMRCPSFILM
jgi:hypothetical protein